jgi:beta-glucosidase
VADVLFGDENPGGRLPITFPMSEGQLPLVYNHKPTGRGDDYLDLTGHPLFPFGYGLSYTTFEYSNLVITPADMPASGTATVRCTVKNTGSVAGDEVVQLYVRDVLATVARPVMMLEGFSRIHLAPGEQREVAFTLSKSELQMLDADMRWVVEPGTFRVLVGSSVQGYPLARRAGRSMKRREFVALGMAWPGRAASSSHVDRAPRAAPAAERRAAGVAAG